VPATAVLALPQRWHDRGSTVVADRLGRFLVLRRAIQLLRQDVWLDRRGRHPADVVLCDGVHHPRRRRAEFGNREGAGTQLSAAALTPPIRLRMMSLLLSSVNMTNSAERGSCSHDVAPRYPGAGTIPGEDANNEPSPKHRRSNAAPTVPG